VTARVKFRDISFEELLARCSICQNGTAPSDIARARWNVLKGSPISIVRETHEIAPCGVSGWMVADEPNELATSCRVKPGTHVCAHALETD